MAAETTVQATQGTAGSQGAQGGARVLTREEIAARVRAEVEQARAEVREAQQGAQLDRIQANALEQADRALQAAAAAQGAAGGGGVNLPPPPTRVRVENGRVIVDETPQATTVETIEVPAGPPRVPGKVIPEDVMMLSYAFMLMIVLVVLGSPLMRAFGRWLDRRGTAKAALPGELASRLDRIEQAVDTMAVEVERISEGQRFTARLMSEMRDAPRLDAARVAEPRT